MESIENKKIVIMGGTGFLGKFLIRLLLDDKANVILLSRNTSMLSDFYEATISGQLTIINGDVLDKSFLQKSINKVDSMM